MTGPMTGDQAKARETYRGVAHPWQCDVMGHLTTRFYAAMFDDASYHFTAYLGGYVSAEGSERLGWADVRLETDFLAELRAGDLTLIRSRPLRIGSKSMTTLHEMENLKSGAIAARLTMTTVRFDLDRRKAAPLEPALRRKLEAWIAGNSS